MLTIKPHSTSVCIRECQKPNCDCTILGENMSEKLRLLEPEVRCPSFENSWKPRSSSARLSEMKTQTSSNLKEAPERRFKRGYDVSHLSAAVQKALKNAERCKPMAVVVEAVVTVASIPALVFAFVWSAAYVSSMIGNAAAIGIVLAFGYVVTAVLIARQQRGLELMVHDASHRAWIRSNPTLNNHLADFLVAFPVLSSIDAYWKSHRIHHRSFGSHLDPCRQRFADMGLAHLDLSTKWRITCAVIAWLPSYNKAYYAEIGSLSVRQWMNFTLWHVVVMIIPAAVIFSMVSGFDPLGALSLAFVAWIGSWMIPFTVFLPVLRSIAESEEHDYSKGKTEFGTTFTNDGWVHRALIHPKNDSYHLVHHMFPNIPERQHRQMHKLLMQNDSRYRSALRRSSVLQSQ